jgi:hypothetical protein
VSDFLSQKSPFFQSLKIAIELRIVTITTPVSKRITVTLMTVVTVEVIQRQIGQKQGLGLTSKEFVRINLGRRT